MKRLLQWMLPLLLLLALPGVRSRAAYEVVDVPVWVEVRYGGTVRITQEGDSPPPEPSTLVLGANQSEAFHIRCSNVGNFSYLVREEPDGRDLNYDTTEYRVTLCVIEENGALHVGLVVYTVGGDGKYVPPQEDDLPQCRLRFVNAASTVIPRPTPSPQPRENPEPTETPQPTEPPETTEPPEATETPDPTEPPGPAQSPQPGAPPDSGEPPEETELDERAAAVGDPLSELDDNGLPRANMEGQPDGSPANANASSQPRTGDDTRLDLYLSLAIASAAGLFALALGYRRASRK
ncbi:MAG: hypothetical protein K5990_08125 [Oscillospiraceae bacterium]|nr:hypothetical protein [Oscillospiraceae bacterium]